MNPYKTLTIYFSLFLILSCSVSKIQKKGKVSSENFDYKTEFTTYKSLIVFPAKINGIERNFIFDSGAESTVIQRDSIIGKNASASGASKIKKDAGSEIIKSFKIGDVEFIETYAMNIDMIGLRDNVPNFGGLIGQTIAKKANWMIDYPNKTIRLSNKNLSDETFQTLEVTIKNGRAFTNISIDGIKQKVLIDFGSASEFNLPKETKLANELINKYDFKENQREQSTITGLQKITEKIGTIPLIKLGNIEFKNIKTNVNTSNQARIGIGFFKDFQIYIDNDNESIKIKK